VLSLLSENKTYEYTMVIMMAIAAGRLNLDAAKKDGVAHAKLATITASNLNFLGIILA
jgi:hypothetical protein